MHRIIFWIGFITVLLMNQLSLAQTEPIVDSVDNMIIYNRERMGMAIAHHHGFGLGYRSGKNINSFRTRIFAFEAVTLKSGKEIKTINPYWENSKRYVYGKLNDVIVLRAGYAQKYLLNRKPYWGGIELRWFWETGMSLALEKPYYLFVIKIIQLPSGELDYDIVTGKFDDSAYSWDDIYGRAPFTKGFNEINLVPGVYGKLGLNFEFGSVKTSIRAGEIGVALDFYPQTLNIMDDGRDQTLFLNFYISYVFGKRFNKY